MIYRARFAAAMVAVVCSWGCGSKLPSGGGGKSAPMKEVDTISHMGSNPAPIADPVGAIQIYKGAKHQLGCENNLAQIALSLQLYVSKTGSYPAPGTFFKTMVESGDIADINICAVPRSNITREDVLIGMGNKVYKWTMDPLNDSTPAEKPIVWDPVAFEDGRHYLKFSGSVAFATEDQFQAMMTKWEGK